MLILARFMRLKALDNSQTDRGSVARYTPTVLECAMFVGVAPLLYDLLTSSFRQLALLFTQGTGYFRLYAKVFRNANTMYFLDAYLRSRVLTMKL